MTFTGQLGTADSQLGNIELASPGGPPTYELIVNIDGIAAVTISLIGNSYHTVTIDGITAVTITLSGITTTTLSIAGIAAFTVLPGQLYVVNTAIEGLSNIELLPGIGYFDTVELETIDDIAIAQIGLKLISLSIDGISDISTATLQNGRISLAVAGIAAITLEPSFGYVLTFSMAGIASIYEASSLNTGGTDGIYNFVTLTSNNTLDVLLLRQSSGNENPASAGSVSVDCHVSFGRILTQTLTLTQLAVGSKPVTTADTSLVMSQLAVCQRIRLRSLTDTLTLTQDVQSSRPVINTIVFTGTAAVTKILTRTVSQTLTMTQTGQRITVLNLSVVDTLVMGITRVVTTPIIGTINNSGSTPFQYTQPVAQAILVPSRCLVILGVPTQSVVLPCPQFADSQSRSDTLNLKRTMTGDTYTYVRKTELQKLKYTFQMGTYKAHELKRFLIDHCHEVLWLINHKGETWYVNLANNPFEFIAAERWQKRGERHDVTLEFEGVQL